MTQAPPPPHEAVERLEDGRDLTGETVMGMRVAGWRWKEPVPEELQGSKWGWAYASHWSTPGEHREVERLFTEADVRAHLRQVEEREAVMREGLNRMANASESVGRKHFREEAAELLERTALTHSPETDGEG